MDGPFLHVNRMQIAARAWLADSAVAPPASSDLAVFHDHRSEIRDWLTRQITAFESFAEMVETPRTYRPTLRTSESAHATLTTVLADEYDRAQALRGDSRVAFRGG